MTKYYNYGITINPEYAEKIGDYYIYVFKGTRVLSTETKFGFATLEQLEPEDVIKMFDGTCGVNGYKVDEKTIHLIIN